MTGAHVVGPTTTASRAQPLAARCRSASPASPRRCATSASERAMRPRANGPAASTCPSSRAMLAPSPVRHASAASRDASPSDGITRVTSASSEASSAGTCQGSPSARAAAPTTSRYAFTATRGSPIASARNASPNIAGRSACAPRGERASGPPQPTERQRKKTDSTPGRHEWVEAVTWHPRARGEPPCASARRHAAPTPATAGTL